MCTGFTTTGSSGVDETLRQWIMRLVTTVNPGRDIGRQYFIFLHFQKSQDLRFGHVISPDHHEPTSFPRTSEPKLVAQPPHVN